MKKRGVEGEKEKERDGVRRARGIWSPIQWRSVQCAIAFLSKFNFATEFTSKHEGQRWKPVYPVTQLHVSHTMYTISIDSSFTTKAAWCLKSLDHPYRWQEMSFERCFCYFGKWAGSKNYIQVAGNRLRSSSVNVQRHSDIKSTWIGGWLQSRCFETTSQKTLGPMGHLALSPCRAIQTQTFHYRWRQ